MILGLPHLLTLIPKANYYVIRLMVPKNELRLMQKEQKLKTLKSVRFISSYAYRCAS